MDCNGVFYAKCAFFLWESLQDGGAKKPENADNFEPGLQHRCPHCAAVWEGERDEGSRESEVARARPKNAFSLES